MRSSKGSVLFFALATGTTMAGPAIAQPAPPADAPPVGNPGPVPVGAEAPSDVKSPAEPDAPPRDVLEPVLRPSPGGLTLRSVARQASETSLQVEASRARLRAASAQVDRAIISYFPTLTLVASYTRVSDTNSAFDTGGGSVLGAANEGPVTAGPCPGDPTTTCVLDSGGLPVAAQQFDFSFPTILNQWSLTASLVVPISDYVLRLPPAMSAARSNVDAQEASRVAAERTAAADAQIALLQWVRARGQAAVAAEAIAQTQAHVADARVALEAGAIARADVLRLEAQLARSEQLHTEADAFEQVAAEQLRTSLHIEPSTRITLGEDITDDSMPQKPPPLDELLRTAYTKRPEILASQKATSVQEEAESLTTAKYLPRVEAFGNAMYANPNPRFVPSKEQWDFSWDVGVRAIWVVNETFSTLAEEAESESATAEARANEANLRDAIRREVVAAYTDVAKAGPNINAAEREVAAADASLTARRKLFKFGRATAADLIDAETELTRARLALLDAKIGQRAAWVRLRHAIGEPLGN